MTIALHLPDRLLSMDDDAVRKLSQELAAQFHTPSIEEAMELLEENFFKKLKSYPPLKIRRHMACVACEMQSRRNSIHDHLGGTYILFRDKKKICITSDMSQRKILFALKKARNTRLTK